MPGHSGGLTKWFKEGWVDISRPRKGGGYAPCGRKSARKCKRGYPKCVPAGKAASMSKKDKKSATTRKRAAYKGKGAPSKKPKLVKTKAEKICSGGQL